MHLLSLTPVPMTKLLLLITAGFGPVSFACPSASAQPATNAVALNAATTATLPAENRSPDRTTDPVHFCGENLPVNYPAVTERWTRTLVRQAAMAGDLVVLKRRASVVFPLIEPILKLYRIPADFKFLPLLESAVINRAVSRRGAAGFWQLMPQTAQSLGLTVSHRRDERFDLRKATHAACRYINDLYKQLGSWMLVATAYNAGPNYIEQLTRRHPTMHPMALPYRAAETRAYLFQTVAIKELLTHPQVYQSYLSSRHLAALSDGTTTLPSSERAAILTSFDLDETAFKVIALRSTASVLPAFVADSTTAVVLLIDDEPTPETSIAREPAQPVDVLAPVVGLSLRLSTRSLSEGPLTEGKLCLFQVVQPVAISGRVFSVGDVIQAHIEIIDAASGRVFLRTDRYTTAQSQETVSLNLVATGQPRHPGVDLPTRLEGWGLNWESL